MAEEILLDVKKLVLHFATTRGPVQAVDGVDFQLDYNKAVVILGESGCGKSSLAKAILRLLPRNVKTYSGEVRISGKDVMPLSEEEFRHNVRWVAVSLVPQAAMNALRRDSNAKEVAFSDFEKAMEEVPPSIAPEIEKWYRSFMNQVRRLQKPAPFVV